MRENGKNHPPAVANRPPCGWTPVTERLPEKGQWVIVGGVKPNRNTVVCEATISGLSLSNPGRAWAATRGKYFEVLASHWMPLPGHPWAAPEATAPDLLEAARDRLAECRENGECTDVLPDEYCSDQCVALARAVAKAEGCALNERGSLAQGSPDGETPQATTEKEVA